MLLHEFNYYFNKAINQYINKKYNIYDVNQQTTDDLRVLKSTAMLTPTLAPQYDASIGAGASKLFGGTFEVDLPHDYLHMLNCVCMYQMSKDHKCYNQGDWVDFSAKRLTADAWSNILNDYYNRPLPERPYYYIHNVSNDYINETETDTNHTPGFTPDIDMEGLYKVGPGIYDKDDENNTYKKGDVDINVLGGTPEKVENTQNTGTNFDRTITIGGNTVSTVERATAYRYGNASKVRCEIRYGRDNSIYQLKKVFIDYIKAPQVIRLTKEQVDLTEDTSQIMEFPDYVCQEIINELTTLVMARDGDPRLQVQTQVSQSIAQPAQQQAQPQPQARQQG